MKKLYKVISIVALMLMGCSDPKEANRVLDNSGYTEIQIHGWSYWGCGKDDAFTTRFSAKNPNGKVVSGYVCSSWFSKGSTVRF
jgi:hypothetical protein